MKAWKIYLFFILVSSYLCSQTEIYDLLSIKFIDNSTGIATGGTSVDHGFILHTNDGGETWQILDNFFGELVWESEYFENDHILLFAFDSLYISTESIYNYRFLPYPEGFSLLDAYFISKDIGWISGSGGFLYSTVDGGEIWMSQTINSPGAGIGKLFFFDRKYGWCSNVNNLFFTKDGGTNWTLVENTSSTNSIYFVDSLTGYRTDHQFIYKSIDGGLNWEGLNLISGKTLIDIFATSEQECFILAGNYDGASVFKTTDGGTSWTEFNLTNSNWLSARSITFSDSSTGWICCRNARIYKTTNAGNDWFELDTGLTVTDIEEESNNVSNFKLSNNYPNPFNSSTKIVYSIAENDNVKIILFDYLGRELKTLFNGRQQPGEYELDINLFDYPSGVYLYKIISGKFSDVNKMILLK